MATYDVFISYSRPDHGTAVWLDSTLRAAGLTTFFDDRGLHAGESVPVAIGNAIAESKLLCAIVTPRYGRTWYTRLEGEKMAEREGMLAPTRVIPCLFEGEPPVFLGERSYVDFRASGTAATVKLVASIRAHLDDHDRRTNGAATGAGVVILLGLAVWFGNLLFGDGSADAETGAVAPPRAAERWRTLEPSEQRLVVAMEILRRYATTDRLKAYLVKQKLTVPRSKADRVQAVVTSEKAPQTVLRSFFLYRELQNIARRLDVRANGTAVELAGRIVRARPPE